MYMLMFNEDIKARDTTYDINFLTVSDFQEIYFDVYELVINGNKYIAEKVSEYQGMPVVTIPVTINGIAEDSSFVLKKGTQEVLFNKNNSLTFSNKQSTDTDFLDSLNEDSISEISNLYIDSEAINEELEKAKLSAAKYAKDIKEQKIEEATQAIERKKKDAKKEIESYKKDLLNEFYGLTEDIRSSLHESNTAEQLVIRKNVSETLEILSEELDTRIEKASEGVKKFYDNKIKLIEESVLDITKKQRDDVIAIINESKQSLLDQINTITVPQSSVIIERDGKSTLDLKELKTEIEKKITAKFSAEMGSLKRYIELSSGGGSVAQQFSNGGTMNGSLTVTGTISASQYLGIVTSTGNEVYIGGNSVGANMLIGTNDNFNLNIETAGTTKMTVTSAGNVGIGTTTPTGKLDVLLNPLTTYTTEKITFGPSITLGHYGSGYSGLWLGGLSGSTSVINPGPTNYTLLSDGSGLLINGPNNISLSTSGTPKMYVTYGGNVGIGTTAPVTRLHVNGEYSNNGIYISRGATSIGYLGSYSSYIASGTNDSLILSTYGSNCLINPSTGNVGIGTTAPAAKLQVGPGDSGNLVVIPGAGGSDGSFALRWSSDERLGFTSNAVQYGFSGISGGALRLGGGTNFGYIVGNSINGNILLNPTSGNIGIGTTAPGAKLHVIGNAIFGENVVSGSATPLNVSLGGSYGTSTPGSKANLKLDIYRDETGGRAGIGISGGLMEFQGPTGAGFGFYPNNGTVSALQILANGNVGIGTTTPNYIFSVKPSTGYAGQIGFSTYGAGQPAPTIYLEDFSGTGSFKIGLDNGSRLNILSPANSVCFFSDGNGTSINGNGTLIESGNSTATIQTVNSRILLNPYATNAIQFFSGSTTTERMRILGSNGNVGIGTTDPSSILTVSGLNISDAATPGNDYLRGILKVQSSDAWAINKGGSIAFSGTITGTAQQQVFGGIAARKENATDGNARGYLALYASGPAPYEKMRVDSNGNVGIGTTAPGAKLHVVGTNFLTSIVDAPLYPALHLYSNGVSIGYIGSGNISGANAIDLGIQTPDGSKLILAAGSTAAALTVNAGRVGIGTSNPSTGLHVYSANTAVATFDGPTSPIAVFSNSNSQFASFGSAGGSLTGGTVTDFAFQTSNNLVFATGGTALANIRMFVASTGNVGIGNTNPGYKLDVHGSVRLGGFFLVDRSGGNNTAAIQFSARGATEGANFGNPIGNGSGEIIVSGLNGLIIGNQNATPLVFGTSNLERIRILANGNVGIGTTTPGAKLQINVSNGTPEEALRLLTTNGNLNNGSYISFFSQANELGRIKGLTTSGGSNIGQILLNPVYAGTELNGIKILASSSFATVSINTTTANSGLTVKSSYNGATILSLLDHADIEKFTVLNSGNLGIGTTAPASKITVAGGDIELTDASAGVIFKTPDGTKRYRMTIDNAGAPVFTLLS